MILQIRNGTKVVKAWYGCVVNESCTLSDVYTEYSSGKLDGALPIPEELLGAAVEAFVGPNKCSLTRVNCECTVGDAVSALGQYIEYSLMPLSVLREDTQSTSTVRSDAMAILMSGATEKSPDKWVEVTPNRKLKLKNDVIDWLRDNKLGWEAAYAKQLGLSFVNILGNTLWALDGNHETLADRSCYVPTMFQQFQGYN